MDGENLPVGHAGFLIITAAKRGVLCVKRVYGAVPRLDGWTTAPGFRVVHVPARKDSADIALSLDALELGLTKQVDEIILATSDRDMSLVAQRLGELGIPVTGIGEEKAPDEFRKSCRSFVAVPGKKAVSQTQPFDARMRDFLRQEGVKTDGWVTLSALGQSRAKSLDISKASAGIGKSASWIDWFKKQPSIYEIEERGTQSRARLKPVHAG